MSTRCLNPFNVKQDDVNIAVPCGKCYACKKRRISGWSFRLMQEDRVSQSSMFITLTYDTRAVPISRNGFMSLNKRDVQLFFKRLRHLHGSQQSANPFSIKYYLVGEYGGKTARPHYHAIVFNAKFELVEKAWQNGMVHFGQVNGASVGYTLKYMCKTGKIPMHRNDDRVPEFSLMSKGLGVSYVNKNTIKWHNDDGYERMYLPLEDGKKCAMPRYYKDRLYTREVRSEIVGYLKGKLEDEILNDLIKIGYHDMNDAQRKIYLHNKRQDLISSNDKYFKTAENNRTKL